MIDSAFLSTLAKQGIDKSRIVLIQDYAKPVKGVSSPYAQVYADTLSRKRFAVISGLPMVDAYGQTHELLWSDKTGKFENGNNIFHSVIDKGSIRILALSDQPTGAKTNDSVSYYPQLFIDGVEIKPISDTPKIINDPLNENYAYNTLEWNYGVCLRRVRIIEGRFLGSWVFLTNPKTDVFIRYNQSGKLRLRLQYARDEDTESIPKEFFDKSEYPVTISDSATFYPDADPETTSVDGWAEHDQDDTAFATIRNGAGVLAVDTSAEVIPVYIGSGTNVLWYAIRRGLYLFDTSSLPDSATISAATLSIRGYNKYDNFIPAIGGTYNIYSSAPASNVAIVAGDYDSLGTNAYCDTVVTWANWSTTNYNNWAFNAAGIAAINKTGVSKFGLREASYDVANSEPAWSKNHGAGIFSYMSEKGTGYKPKLVVTYTTGPTPITVSDSLALADALPSGTPKAYLSLTDSLALADALPSGTPKAYVPVSDSLGLTDVPGIKVSFTLTDVLSLTDVALGTRLLSMSDTLSVSDAISLLAKLPITDSLVLTDQIPTIAVRLTVSDTLNVAEALAIKAYITIPDNLSLAEGIVLKVFISVADSLTLAEAIAAKNKIDIEDSLALAEAVALRVFLTISDSLAVAEAIGLKTSLTISDVLSLAETISARTKINIDDSLIIAEAVSKIISSLTYINVQDNLSLTESTPVIKSAFTINEGLYLNEVNMDEDGFVIVKITPRLYEELRRGQEKARFVT
jgi:hypothetical protein